MATAREAVEFGWGPRLVEAVCAADVVRPAAATVLAEIDPGSLDAEHRVSLVQAWERVAAVVAGHQQRALAAVVEATEDLGLAGELARHEVGAALRVAPSTGAALVHTARQLAGRLPATLAALTQGRVGYRQAACLAEAVTDLPDALAAAVQARVLPRMPDQSLAETRRAVSRAVAAADPAAAARRHQQKRRERRVELVPLPEGMHGWWFTLPAQVSGDAWAALTARATAEQAARRRLGLADPGLDALRVDTLVAAVLGPQPDVSAQPQPQPRVCAEPEIPSPVTGSAGSRSAAWELTAAPRRLPRCSCGGAQTAAVVVDLPTLLGLAERPGEVPGYGPVPAALAREMAADRAWQRWLVDPETGHLLDRGAGSYQPSDALRAFVAARDTVCGFPGCHQPARRCDCDHVIAYGAPGGQTIRINLGPLCRQHHNAKTHGRWQLHYDPTTRIKTWTSPLGKTYTQGTDPPLL